MATVEITILLDDAPRLVEARPTSVGVLRTELGIPRHVWLSLEAPTLERFLQSDEEIELAEGTRLATCVPLLYKPSPKHKSKPARGVKGSLCPSGVSGAGLLAQSCLVPAKPRRRWATHQGRAYCAMHDNVDSWHGYPVEMTAVPAPVWRAWLDLGKIGTGDLRMGH